MNELTHVPPLPDAWAAPQATAALDQDWQPLPARGARLAALGSAIGFALPLGFVAAILSLVFRLDAPWLLAPIAALMGAMGGAWLGVKRHRLTRWKLDEDGFALQRGNWWRIESRVPISRVQHLDLKRGPLERMLRLATLVIHTAGTRMAAVSVAGLDGEDAERLRDCLARQLDQDDDAL